MDGMYTNYFGFVEAPFGGTPDPRFFYRNHSYQEALTLLQHAIEDHKGIVLCAGEVGTGKTLLLKMLMQNLESKGRAILITNAWSSIDKLLRLILSRLGVSTLVEDRLVMPEHLAGALVGQRKASRMVALLIDEAQDLSEKSLDDLRLLSNLEAEGEPLLQMVLMGQPELERKLDQPQLRPLKQRVALRRRLSPLAHKEIGAYIGYRVQAAGYDGQKLFDSDALEKIALYSGGIPRVINTLCDNALGKAYAAGSRHVTAAIAEDVARNLELHAKSEPQTMDVGLVEFPQESSWKIPGLGETESTASNAEPWQSDMIRLVEPEDLAIPDRRSTLLKKRRFNRESITRLRRVATPIGLLVMLALGGVLWYSQSEIALSELAPKIDFSELATKFKGLADDWSPVWRNLETIFQKNLSVDGSSAFLRHNPEPSVPVQKSQRDDTDVLQEKDADAQKASETTVSAVESARKTATADHSNDQSKPQPSDSKPTSVNSTAERTGKQKSGSQKGESSLGIFEVVGASYVRDKPASEAEIIATLQPGTRIQVLAQTRDYFQVRSLEDRAIRGYVHREDAFFERRKQAPH
jgi:general secretion pathway protein A